jgi:hypothetical protein
MADQARSLDSMMSRYHVSDEDIARVQSRINATQSGGQSAGSGAPAQDRRGSNRPWSGGQSQGAKQAPARSAPKAATGTDDADWQEF